jgi:DNA-binding transcriptional LysR family regulator
MNHLRSIWSIKNGLGLRELRAVLAVAELGSFRAAAVELGYTQSALSHQVQALEAALGSSLFDRPGGRAQIRLTPAGEAVCRRARRVLSEVEGVAADVEEAERGSCLRLRVGVSQTTAAEIMPPALRTFRVEYPSVEVVLQEFYDFAASSDALRQGDLDIAFADDARSDQFVQAEPLLEDPWVILTRRDSPIAELRHPDFHVLDGLDLVAWSHEWKWQLEIEQGWQQRGITPKIVYRTNDTLALQRLVAAGLGHACTGRLLASRAVDPALTWLDLHDELSPRQIVLCYPRHRQLPTTAVALITAIRAQVAA